MKRCALFTILVLSLSAVAHARTAHRSSHSAPDPMYSSALAAANRFLHAWQDEDHETGIVMLADSARQKASPELLQVFFSPGSNAAYEIAHGQRLKQGEYAFPVVLFGTSKNSRTRYCKLLIIRAGNNEWAVEKLP